MNTCVAHARACATFLLALASIAPAADRVFTPYSAVQQLVQSVTPSEASWNDWARKEDASIRARLEQGDLDSVINLLLFGTSFTKQKPIRVEDIALASKSGMLRSRLLDLLQGLRRPGANERLVFVRKLLEARGMNPDSDDGSRKAGVFVLENLERVLKELRTFAQRAEKSEAGSEFATRSRLFHDRGVSLDTSVLPSFGLEETLREMKARGLLREGAVNRAAVIGPGLDFADWDTGYDFYPQQTLQPFALLDSLARVGLARPGAAAITVFDISPRVLDHLRAARERARGGRGYPVQLPRDPARRWLPPVVAYWQVIGDQAGAAVRPIRSPAVLPGLETRAVEFPPVAVLACEPVDLNIVVERLDLPSAERFDLVVATNVFVYYEAMEQSLALQNVAAMLKPGGFLLSNNELPRSPQVPIRAVGTTQVRYNDRSGGGDSFIWYQRE